MYQGLVNASAPGQIVVGFPVLKGMNDLSAIIPDLTRTQSPKSRQEFPESSQENTPLSEDENWPSTEKLPCCRIIPDYHFGGYARSTPELLDFMNRFYQTTGIPSDFVYTGKLLYGAMDLLQKGFFPPGSRLLLIHSGGLQGNQSLSPGVLDF